MCSSTNATSGSSVWWRRTSWTSIRVVAAAKPPNSARNWSRPSMTAGSPSTGYARRSGARADQCVRNSSMSPAYSAIAEARQVDSFVPGREVQVGGGGGGRAGHVDPPWSFGGACGGTTLARRRPPEHQGIPCPWKSGCDAHGVQICGPRRGDRRAGTAVLDAVASGRAAAAWWSVARPASGRPGCWTGCVERARGATARTGAGAGRPSWRPTYRWRCFREAFPTSVPVGRAGRRDSLAAVPHRHRPCSPGGPGWSSSLDDAHWADPLSLELLETLVRRPPATAAPARASASGRAPSPTPLMAASRSAARPRHGARPGTRSSRAAADAAGRCRRRPRTTGAACTRSREATRCSSRSWRRAGTDSRRAGADSLPPCRPTWPLWGTTRSGTGPGRRGARRPVRHRHRAPVPPSWTSPVGPRRGRRAGRSWPGASGTSAVLREFAFRHPVIRSAVYEGQSGRRTPARPATPGPPRCWPSGRARCRAGPGTWPTPPRPATCDRRGPAARGGGCDRRGRRPRRSRPTG